MSAMTQAQVEEFLRSYIDALATCIQNAWYQWKQLERSVPRPLSTRSRASCMYDFVCGEVRQRFDGDPNVSHSTRYGMLTLNFSGLLVVRFKKVDDDLRSSNIATERQERFSMQMELPDMPQEALRLVVGYRLDMLQASIADIHVICPKGREVDWHYPIYAAVPDVLPLPEIAYEPEQTPTIRAKNPRKNTRRGNE